MKSVFLSNSCLAVLKKNWSEFEIALSFSYDNRFFRKSSSSLYFSGIFFPGKQKTFSHIRIPLGQSYMCLNALQINLNKTRKIGKFGMWAEYSLDYFAEINELIPHNKTFRNRLSGSSIKFKKWRLKQIEFCNNFNEILWFYGESSVITRFLSLYWT